MNEELKMISTTKIIPHPDNPRVDVGDVSELAKSIETNGIMQNLTVIPGKKKGEYMALIGHRRLAAAKKAGVKEVPCRVVEGLSHREQVSIMLEENMQRNDLTIWEQAKGFQMMLDLGETEDTIAEKTGFSKQTVKHRLNIAKLDQEILGTIEESADYQLTLTDLYELEKIPDIEKRNEILANAHENNSIKYQVGMELRRIKRNALYESVKAAVLETEPKAKEEKYISGYWGSEYQELLSLRIDDEMPKEITIDLPDEYSEIIYGMGYDSVRVYARVKKEEPKETEAEKKKKEAERKRKQIRQIEIQMGQDRRSFIAEVAAGKYKCTEDLKEMLWKLIVEEGTFVTRWGLVEALSGKHQYQLTAEEMDRYLEEAETMPTQTQMLAQYAKAYDHEIKTYYIVDYDGAYNGDHAEKLKQLYKILGKYGFTLTDPDHIATLDGTHELYAAPKEDK